MIDETLRNEVEALSTITDKPSLVALSYALRHPETWPADFVWDYKTCRTCAIGLSLRLWPALNLPKPQRTQETWIAREMALPLRDAKRIFFGLATTGHYKTINKTVEKKGWIFTRQETVTEKQWVPDWRKVTPDDVADAIDKHLAEQP